MYDKNSNRTQKTVDNTVVNTPVLAENNQYQNYQYDQSGKTLNDGVRSYSYNANGRISSITKDNLTVNNSYNTLGQRVIKTTGSNKTYFNYDESGKLIGEYDNNGNAVREYIYLENMPIALISNERNGEILQIHTDHLQTPKVITDKNGTVLWQWETEAFGSSKPKIESIKMPLRMAGQYADDEVGLFYNYYRFYDPNMGRYVENDPIGLEGGLNVYGYVGGSPLLAVDPLGLDFTNFGGGGGGRTVPVTVPIRIPAKPTRSFPKAVRPIPPIILRLPDAVETGEDIADSIDIDNDCNDPQSDNCKKIAVQCKEKCIDSQLTSNGNNGFDSNWDAKCYNSCMKNKNCSPFQRRN